MRIKRRYNGRIENEMNGGIQYNFGGLVPEFYPTPSMNPICPEQLIVSQSIGNQGCDIEGIYNRKYDYSGGTFLYAYWWGGAFGTPSPTIGVALDGNYYPVYQKIGTNIYIIRRFASPLGIDNGYAFWDLNYDPFFSPNIGSTCIISNYYGYTDYNGARFPQQGLNNNAQLLWSMYLSYPSVCPTSTPTPTISLTPSITPTISLTPSITPTISLTPSITKSPTTTPTITPTITKTPTLTPTKTPTQSLSVFSYLGRTTPDQASGALACSNYLTIRSYFSNKTLASLTIGDYLYDSYPATPTNGGNNWVALRVGGVGQGYAFQVATDGEILDTYTC